jgi:hypothetical protein
MSFLPPTLSPPISRANTASRNKKTLKDKGKSGTNGAAPGPRKDSLMNVNVFACEQLHDTKVGINTGEEDYCPICQIDCISRFRLTL